MSGHSAREVVCALFACRTRSEAAEALGVSRSTLYRLLRRAAVQKEIEAYLDSVRGSTSVYASQAVEEAIATLRELATDPKVSAEVRMKASLHILEHFYSAEGVQFEE